MDLKNGLRKFIKAIKLHFDTLDGKLDAP